MFKFGSQWSKSSNQQTTLSGVFNPISKPDYRDNESHTMSIQLSGESRFILTVR